MLPSVLSSYCCRAPDSSWLLCATPRLAQFAHTGGSDRLGLINTLRTREVDALSPRERLDALCWLVDNTSQCATVREHLEKNAEASLEFWRERRQLMEEEALREGEEDEEELFLEEEDFWDEEEEEVEAGGFFFNFGFSATFAAPLLAVPLLFRFFAGLPFSVFTL